MDHTIKIQKLYSELSAMENALKDFVKPRSANHPHEWTQEEAEKHLSLTKYRNDIVAELTQLEGGHLQQQHRIKTLPRIDVARIAPGILWKPIGHLIQAVAEELLRKKTLNAADVKTIILRCERELDSS